LQVFLLFPRVFVNYRFFQIILHNYYNEKENHLVVLENEEQMRKKRLTAESNPENYYTLRVTKEQRIPKFNTTALHYKVDNKNLDVKDLSYIVKTFKVLFQSIISNITEFMQPNARSSNPSIG
jgi:hypothetical protein